ncbi:sugar phosphate isomerase/epimerase [Oscillospiraceae bacterium OttesenSCG-928-F05]|nr:sugar phosphate isomerase/epimerase [Oscillospiraceae bacterium OttesenSCG-928-F05]
MPKFGVSIYSISSLIMSGQITPAEGVRWLCENGAETIEIVPFGIDLVGTPGLIDEFKKISGEFKIPIENYSLNANFLGLSKEEYDAEVVRVKEHMDAAFKLGVSTMRIDSASFRRPYASNTTENFQKELPLIIETYEMLCDYAAPHGVTVLLENHGFHINGAERTRQVLLGVNRPNFAHQLDVGNYACVDDRPEIAVMRNVDKAKVVHMKDFYIRDWNHYPGECEEYGDRKWIRTLNGNYLRGSITGHGDLNLRHIMKVIKDSGFDGSMFIEYEGMEEPKFGTFLSLQNMKRLWSEV